MLSNFSTTRQEVKTPEFKSKFGIDKLELLQSEVSFEIKNAHTIFANALRRAATDEIPRLALSVGDIILDDKSQFSKMVSDRIQLIRINQAIDPNFVKKAVFSIDITNNNAFTIKVYSFDIKSNIKPPSPIFNPTMVLCELESGCSLKIDEITIRSGLGIDNACFLGICRSRSIPLDLQEIPNYDGPMSGFVEQSMIAEPNHFRIGGVVQATIDPHNESLDIFIAACNTIQRRLINVADAIMNSQASSISYLVDGDKCTLTIAKETHTLGTLITKSVMDTHPEKIKSSNYSIAHHEDNMMTIHVDVIDKYSSEITDIMVSSIMAVQLKYNSLSEQFIALKTTSNIKAKPKSNAAAEQPASRKKK